MPRTKQEKMEDKRRILKLVLESPSHYKPEDVVNVFYGEIEQEIRVMLGGKTKVPLQEFQMSMKEITNRDEYISTLLEDLKKEKIIGVDSYGKLTVKEPHRAIERYLHEYRELYREIQRGNLAKKST